MSKVLFLLLLSGAVLALSACDLPFGIGSPTTRALENGAAASLEQRTFEITGVYTQTVVAPPPPIVSGARVSAPAVGTRWSIDLQFSNQLLARRMLVSNSNLKLDAIVLPSAAYFSGQAFLLQFLGGDSSNGLADEYFRTNVHNLDNHVTMLVTQKLSEMDGEAVRLEENARLDATRREARAEETRRQLQAWDQVAGRIKEIQTELEDLDRA